MAGLGLFFTGLHLLAASMQPLAGGKMRSFLSRISQGPISRALAGSVLGLITQSTTASAFVCIGLLNSGALPFSSILTLISWSSVGTSLLVFLAAADVRVTGLYVVGLVGIAHLFKAGRHVVARQVIAFLFALGVLFLGIGMIKEVSIEVRDSEWVREFAKIASGTNLVGFALGVIVTLITQSSASVAILGVTLNVAGVLSFNDTLMLVFGSSIGSGLSVVLATSHLNAKQRQLSFYQCIVKITGVVILLPLTALISPYWFATKLPYWVNTLSVGTLIALLYLVLQIVGALVVSLFQDRLVIMLESVCPPSEEDALFEPRYIYFEAAEDADTALVLATREQDRLLASLPDYLDVLRPTSETESSSVPLAVRHAAACHLAGKIKNFMEETVMLNRSDAAIEPILALLSRNETIISLLESLNSFVDTLQTSKNAQEGWASSMVEGLHLILVILRDALSEGSEDREMLFALTQDRSRLIEKVRDSLLSDRSRDFAERQSLFVSTSIFERIIWLIRQTAQSRLPPVHKPLTEAAFEEATVN